jgi:hypothetical protein
MRVLVRMPVVALVAAVAAVAAVMAPLAPAQSATGEWVLEAEPSASATVRYFMHKHVDGHPGNWHILSVRVQQDDDGVTGGLISLRCPKGVQPDPVAGWADCAQVGGADFVDPDYSIAVTWSPRLRRMHITGDIVLEDYVNGVLVPSTIDLRLRADGEFTRTVTRQSFTEPDPWDYKQIDIERDGVTAHGHVGWLEASRTPVTFTRPLHVYWAYSRGYGDGV